MKRSILTFGLLILFVLGSGELARICGSSKEDQKGEQGIEKVRIAHPQVESVSHLPMIIAKQMGFFKEKNLEVEFLQLKSHLALAAMVSGEIDYALTLGSGIRAATRGMPVKGLLVLIDKPLHSLLARPEYKSVKDLKGKRIAGGSAPEGTQYHVLLEILRHNGLDPFKDVNIVYTPTSQANLLVMVSGGVEASLLAEPLIYQAKKRGYQLLARGSDMIPDLPMNGLVATQKKINSDHGQIKRVVYGLLRASLFIHRNRPEAIKILMDWQNYDRPTASSIYENISTSKDGDFTEKGMQVLLTTLTEPGEKIPKIPLDKLVDVSFLHEVQKELGIR